ncbi:Alpha/beta hydrolase family protein [Corynebacterium ciconiae DSM 44920]|uniref:esterase/lipase family protein n=1 Tax=Corynebacterium ciconiae TaxID=227319 RepID=UPI00142EC3F1|nr:alpha/beta fold hydrolase [Corynebacterium ciconiae]WKD61510.1 Alpha/beta hydrolase family protein [Corynebacterium ciconiae DSM 44920]
MARAQIPAASPSLAAQAFSEAPEPSVAPEIEATGVDGPRVARASEAKRVMAHAQDAPLKPAGTNDPTCRVSPERSEAVIMLHGTDSTFYGDYAELAPRLVDAGWCVFGLDYGQGADPEKGFGYLPLEDSAAQVDELVRAAVATSGATGVHVIGFSQGASVGRMWVNAIDRGKLTRSWIGIASPTRGGGPAHLGSVVDHLKDRAAEQATSQSGSVEMRATVAEGLSAGIDRLLQPSLQQLLRGSRAIEAQNTPAETVPGPRYTTIATRVDEMIWDVDVQSIHGPMAQNLVVQDVCPHNLGGHMYSPYNPTVMSAVLNLLDNWQDGGDWGDVTCRPVPLGFDMPELIVVDNLRKMRGDAPHDRPVTYVTRS